MNSYTQADNSVVVATDSIKNITYCEWTWICDMRRVIDREEGTDLAKISPHILSAERFGLHLATHFVSKYAHIRKALVTIEQLRWSRITVDGKPHGHSFLRDGDEKRVAKVEVDGSRGKDQLVGNVSAGINDLLGQFARSLRLTALMFSLSSSQVHRVRVRGIHSRRIYDLARSR